ncbi:hypothetical protein E1A91_D05G367700v1 [Gossypium mustelinum]|uniref:Uncharacterized protein n=2 Tax=Gossypium TaxID=3633 RepID=A0A5J5RPF5_GOSBA|nr:hypothetical protein ES319_D05G356900v1 [Gossypium barbadense]TYI84483.1 hypothetical protein E1A91_D05G367700v1 [Gossypium mustelinum]
MRSAIVLKTDPCEYWKLDDTIIKTIETAPDEELQESRDLILHIRRRNLYQVENLCILSLHFCVLIMVACKQTCYYYYFLNVKDETYCILCYFLC